MEETVNIFLTLKTTKLNIKKQILFTRSHGLVALRILYVGKTVINLVFWHDKLGTKVEQPIYQHLSNVLIFNWPKCWDLILILAWNFRRVVLILIILFLILYNRTHMFFNHTCVLLFNQLYTIILFWFWIFGFVYVFWYIVTIYCKFDQDLY